MSAETVDLLNELVRHISYEDRKISPMQVAAHLLEQQVQKYSVPENSDDGEVNKCAPLWNRQFVNRKSVAVSNET